MGSSLGHMAPPGGEAPGGEAPPGGRQAPGGRPPRIAVGHAGRSGRMRMPRGILGAPRPGTKQTVKTTVKPSGDPLARARQYMASRPDIMPKKAAEAKTEKKAAPEVPPVTQSGNMPDKKNMGAGGTEERKAKARARYQARKQRLQELKTQNLGSPGKPRATQEDLDRIQQKQNKLEPLTKEEIAILDAEEAQPNPATEEDRKKQTELAESKQAEKARMAQIAMDTAEKMRREHP